MKKSAASEQGEVVKTRAPGGTEHILFVDDEEMLVQAGQLMLEHLAYKVTARTDSMEVLSLFRAQAESFDLVICDITMPKMNGLELARRLMEIRPDVPIILATGFSPDSHFSFDSANHRVASDAFIYAGWKALKALRRSTPNG